jgi:hypothetical protein
MCGSSAHNIEQMSVCMRKKHKITINPKSIQEFFLSICLCGSVYNVDLKVTNKDVNKYGNEAIEICQHLK